MRIAGLIQDLTYWAPGGENQFGVRTRLAPILIKGHWEDRNEEVHTIGGNTIVSRAVAYVDRDLGINGYLAQGDKTDVAEPTQIPDAWEIKAFNDSPDLRSCTTVRKAIM